MLETASEEMIDPAYATSAGPDEELLDALGVLTADDPSVADWPSVLIPRLVLILLKYMLMLSTCSRDLLLMARPVRSAPVLEPSDVKSLGFDQGDVAG
jgi:hypothetical protein